MNPTHRQKLFLRALGHTQLDNLTKKGASQLIDRLLQDEKASGKTFPCPYCKQKFGPRPKRTKTCPSCKKTIVHLSGRFFTEEKANELNQKEWLKESRQDNRENVRDDWHEERSFRKEFGEQHTVGYLLRIGPHCSASKHLDGILVLIEDAVKAIELLPPFDECWHDTCECEFDPVAANEVPKNTRVAEFVDPKKQGALTGSRGVKAKGGGCASVVLLVIATGLTWCLMVAK